MRQWNAWIVELALLHDPKLIFVVCLSAVVALLGSLNVAARPAAVLTGRVATAFSVYSLFFMVSRLANMFYLPLMATFVDRAVRTGQTGQLEGQIRWVIAGAGLGTLLSFLLLPNFVSLYCYGVEKIEERGSMLRVLLWAARPPAWPQILRQFARRTPLGVRPFQLDNVEKSFLFFNVFATAVWTVGALSAVLVSARFPEYKTTAVLLSGLVNAFAAIGFSLWVDPKAALITDHAIKGQRPRQDVNVAAYHLGLGNCLGSLLGFFFLYPGTWLISQATVALGREGEGFADTIWAVVLLNLVVTMLASTTYASRVSAVQTGRVATAISIYNLFFLITRLTQQVYAPILGSLSDHIVAQGPAHLGELETMFRSILGGAAAGALIGLLLLPTFVQVYNKAVLQLDKRGSIPAVLLACLAPSHWPAILSCIRRPSLMGITRAEIAELPHGFLIGNVIVLSIHTTGVMAAIYAGAELSESLARTAALLSSVVNGVATITLSVVVDPTIGQITDQCVLKKRPERHIFVMALLLMAGMLAGTLLSQLVFKPATWLIELGATLLSQGFH